MKWALQIPEEPDIACLGLQTELMKRLTVCVLGSILCLSFLASATDGIVVSSSVKTVSVEVKDEWRTILFVSEPKTGEISVNATYERVTREGGEVKSRNIIREVSIPWNEATNIASALVLVREQFKAAMPTILTNTP